jgi:hypothetical protein
MAVSVKSVLRSICHPPLVTIQIVQPRLQFKHSIGQKAPIPSPADAHLAAFYAGEQAGERRTFDCRANLLPALSSISTRREMRPLQERLCAHYHQTVSTLGDYSGEDANARQLLS